MRQPTFSRRKNRQQRLMRTGIAIVVVVGVIAVVGNLIGTEEPTQEQEPEQPITVSFTTKVEGYTNAGSPLKPASARKARVTKEADEIKTMLDDWYQRAWVDVEGFADGTFPEVAAYFAPEAKTDFTRDINSLTIGEGRADVTRVEPSETTAGIAIYLEDGKKPTFATADVKFVAVGTPAREGVRPIDIEQTAVLHLEKSDDGWLVTHYEAEQTQTERPPPSPTPTTTSTSTASPS